MNTEVFSDLYPVEKLCEELLVAEEEFIAAQMPALLNISSSGNRYRIIDLLREAISASALDRGQIFNQSSPPLVYPKSQATNSHACGVFDRRAWR